MTNKVPFLEYHDGIQKEHLNKIPLYEQKPPRNSARSVYRLYDDGSLYSLQNSSIKSQKWNILYVINVEGINQIKALFNANCDNLSIVQEDDTTGLTRISIQSDSCHTHFWNKTKEQQYFYQKMQNLLTQNVVK